MNFSIWGPLDKAKWLVLNSRKPLLDKRALVRSRPMFHPSVHHSQYTQTLELYILYTRGSQSVVHRPQTTPLRDTWGHTILLTPTSTYCPFSLCWRMVRTHGHSAGVLNTPISTGKLQSRLYSSWLIHRKRSCLSRISLIQKVTIMNFIKSWPRGHVLLIFYVMKMERARKRFAGYWTRRVISSKTTRAIGGLAS